MPTAILNANNGSISSFNNVTGDVAILANLLVEARVRNMILLAFVQGKPIAEDLATLRNDVINEVPNPPI